MNKRQKIIVSITGITLVLLILVGLTYAYFLTRIQGNTNTKSISVTTANLRIVYADGNQNVITKNKIIPGTVIGEKDFTVTNEGNSEADYIVVIDDVAITNVTSSDTATFNSNDFVYTLTCVSKNKNTNEVSGTCDGVSSETSLPLYNDGLLVSNKIAENIRHEYVLTVTYKETGINQSDDMNKKLEAKVDIKDIKALNPYTNGTLAYNIINNAMLKKNGTELRAKPLTKPAEEASTASEKELSITPDDYGTSYYYRGNVEDNYVNFAGMCWRIVRIEGDGATKLILEDSSEECSASMDGNWTIGDSIAFGYDSNNRIYFLNYTGGLADELKTYQTTLNTKIGTKYTSKGLSDYLKVDEWCYDDTATPYSYGDDGSGNTVYTQAEAAEGMWYTDENYGAYTRIHTNKQPSNICTGTKLSKYGDNITDMYVGTLTADEIAYAGGKEITQVANYYITNTYARNNYLIWWVLSPAFWSGEMHDGYVFEVNGSSLNHRVFAEMNSVARPSVVIKTGTTISSGVGTKTNPYVIN